MKAQSCCAAWLSVYTTAEWVGFLLCSQIRCMFLPEELNDSLCRLGIYWVHADFQILCKCWNRKASETDMIQIELSSQSWAGEVLSLSYLDLVTLLASNNIICYLCLGKVDTTWDPQSMLKTMSCICTVFSSLIYL